MVPELDMTEMLRRIAELRVTVFGDFCLDAYWVFEEGEVEHSVETGLPLRRIQEQRYSLGGAGNVVANLIDLGARSVRAVGLAGKDLFGYQMLQLMNERGVNLDGFLQDDGWQTMVYVKPMQAGSERNRIDFGAFNTMRRDTLAELLKQLHQAADSSDVVILNQQVPGGITDVAVVTQLNEVMSCFPHVLFVVDARHLANAYGPAVMKLNSEEAARFLSESWPGNLSLDQASRFASSISEITGKPVFLTRGEQGIVVAANGSLSVLPGVHIDGAVDPVGAGDTVVSAIAASLGCGFTPVEAAALANIAAMITVRKLNVTGTASPAEIIAAAGAIRYAVDPQPIS